MSEKNNAYVVPCDFESMSPKERRIAIAKDVIAGLESQRLVSAPGNYLRLKYDEITRINRGETIDLQKDLATNVTHCRVCAKGAMFIAMVEKFDRIRDTASEDGYVWSYTCGNTRIVDSLRDIFSVDELDLIELFFEGVLHSHYSTIWEVAPVVLESAYEFFYANPDSTLRLMKLMENIIANDGAVKPELL